MPSKAPSTGVVIGPADPRSAEMRTLLDSHHQLMNQLSPPEDVHALDVNGLDDPAITFCVGRVDGAAAVMGALKHLDDTQAEIKSMHTLAGSRGRGLGAAMLDHLLAMARGRGYERVSLETGSMAAFAPAHALYARAGFVDCGPFGGYPDSPNSTFRTLRLQT